MTSPQTLLTRSLSNHTPIISRSAPSSPVASAQSLPQSQSSLQFRRRTPSKIQV
ncbi:hypothetical protein ON05_036585 (plasmid) [Acaryochloris sp. CCMEE 5410]|nr:hypothetical protein ON05_036585 [Acaryochloris sp. CCMEE 5410]